MKDLYKNPIFYYIIAPIAVGLWPLLVWGVYLPDAKKTLSLDIKYSKDGQSAALDILALDPERFNTGGDSNDTGDDFSYSAAVEKVARLCNIPATKYKLSTGILSEKGKQKTQTAHLRLDQVSIVQFAKFLSQIQFWWSTLECEKVGLSKVKAQGLPDLWTVQMDFKYYY